MSTTVLVTGGSGFIGTWVLHELLAHNTVPVVVDTHRATDRWQRVLGDRADQVKWADASLLNLESLLAAIETHGVTHIIHLAAVLTPTCQQDPWLGCQVNVLGSTAIFEAARRSKRIQAISYASSFAVYGPEAADNPQEPNRPPMFYGAFKQAVDLITEQYWRHFQIPSVAIRPYVVYGPERDQGLTAGPSLAARAAATGEQCTIGYNGSVGYDYIEDVARAFVRAVLECPQGATVVDLLGELASIDEFVQAIEAVVPGSAKRIHIDGPTLPPCVLPKANYITNLFKDWRATPLQEGVRKTIDFYRRQS